MNLPPCRWGLWRYIGWGLPVLKYITMKYIRKISVFSFLFWGVWACFHSAHAANHYVRQGATGNGSDWTNAYGNLPDSLTRGDTYYISDGSYGGYTFDDANSGTSVITVKKAIAVDHGTDTGWNSGYGDGQAVFGGFTFATDYWVIDGSTRNEGRWNDGPSYGIKTSGVATNYFWFGHAADNVTLKYLDIGSDYGDSDNESYGDGVYLGGFAEAVENWLVQRSYIHNVRTAAQHAGVHNVIYEYNFIGPNWSKSGIRHQVRGSSVTIRHNIFRNACQGHVSDPTAGYSCTAIVGWYGNAGSNMEDYTNSAVYGNLFIDTVGGVFYNGMIAIGDDRTSQGGGPQDCTGCKVFNNTFVGMGRTNTDSVISIGGGGIITNTEIRNNAWYNIGNHTPTCQAAVCSNNPVIANANAFVNALAENFHLSASGSAGIGDTLGPPYNLDPDGNTRGADGTWDIGAYEYVSGGSDTTPPGAPGGLSVR